MPTNQGETAGARGGFCRGSREFDTGKLELRGRQKQFGRPSQYLRSGAQISWGGRANPFLLFYYLKSVDSGSFAKVRKNERKTKLYEMNFTGSATFYIFASSNRKN